MSVNRIDHLFDTTGDTSGSTEMASGSTIYKIAPPNKLVYIIERVHVYIEDNGKFRGDRYGADESLTNGIDITLHNSSGSLLRYTPQPIKTIGHWGLLAGVDMSFTDFSQGNDLALVRWTISRGGYPAILHGSRGEFLQVETRDNMGAGGAGLVSHLMQAQGWIDR